MLKRFFIVLASVILVIIAGFLIIRFIIMYEPTPNKADVEEMVKVRDLLEFGEVEGAYLLTPRNYGFYNGGSIYIVEQYLDKGGDYGDQYVVIEEGDELTADDEPSINQIKAKEEFQNEYINDIQILSKHRMTVHKGAEEVESAWLFKITYKYDGSHFLTFLLPEKTGEGRFNFFTEGYEQFREF
ncbi:hypothetical protein [Planococcus sp. CAU13]|uniref:hypothetical protein n=1 Tax=Planococcus sp. CAU13 TaxID=1541197 RepID=UPI00052FEB06|nr:hypothetical protein [Planococcus sp. CAU13]